MPVIVAEDRARASSRTSCTRAPRINGALEFFRARRFFPVRSRRRSQNPFERPLKVPEKCCRPRTYNSLQRRMLFYCESPTLADAP
jgi:hypothetical protein